MDSPDDIFPNASEPLGIEVAVYDCFCRVERLSYCDDSSTRVAPVKQRVLVIFKTERSRYGYDVVVRNRDRWTPHRRASCV